MSLAQMFSAAICKIYDIPKKDASLVLAMRRWFLLRYAGEDPLPSIAPYLGSASIAARFGVLMEMVQQIWPERFTICRPCCPAISIDEMLLTQLISSAGQGSVILFDRQCREMIGGDARQLLYRQARRLYIDG